MAGQPTLYKPEYCEQLIAFMGKGYSFEAFAGKIGVCKQTLYSWAEKNPEFLDAKKTAFDKCRLWWESQAIEGVFNENGRTFNSANFIYNMKCRFRDEWTEVNKVEANITGEVKVKHIAQLLDGLSPETLQIVEAELEQKQITGGTE